MTEQLFFCKPYDNLKKIYYEVKKI